MFLDNSNDSTLINVKLTDKGRELLSKGMKEGDFFDIVKFSFGDSEINYKIIDDDLLILSPSSNIEDIKSKLYYSGVKPSGVPTLILSQNVINLTKNQSGIFQTVRTLWDPVVGNYREDYRWINLGPLNDWDFKINLSADKTIATFRSFSITGTTTVKVKGLTSGAYATFTINIT